MKSRYTKMIAALAVCALAAGVYAQTAGVFYKIVRENTIFLNELVVEGAVDLDGTLSVAGATTLASTLAVTGVQTLGPFNLGTATAVSLTSPTVAFAVTSATGYITINSDANQTGVHPTGGTVGQVLTIISGAGSNTIQFDDSASSMTIGGNIVLTEAQNDVLKLWCTSSDGDEWGRLSDATN